MNIRSELSNSDLNTRIEYVVLVMMCNAIEETFPNIGNAFLRPETASRDERAWLDCYTDINDRMFEINRCDGGF